jgi:hypothetical protein
MQWPAVSARGDFRVGFPGLGERELFRQRDDATEPGIELLDPPQVDVRQALGGELLPLDPA